MKQKRPPIVTVLGHVDHGKTTLLDTIRKTNVTAREAGGITQSIGASKIVTSKGTITFIDTPGHAAFSAMRSRGAKVADIAILVVASDDGVMPQTKEAITLILEAEIPYIVALTKSDVASANTEKVLGQLEQEGLLFEGRGGDVPFLEISAKQNKNIEELLELISLIAEVNEISSDPEGKLEAVTIETNKDKQGVLASIVVRNGSIKVSDTVSSDTEEIKVRGLFDDNRKPVKEALPGDPVVILGFTSLPSVGSFIYKPSEGKPESSEKSVRVEKQTGEEAKARIILKAGTKGALEAIIASLQPEVFVFEQGVGDVTENDIFLAKSASCKIITFESKAANSIMKLAESEKVEVKSFRIIYELINYLEEVIHEGDILTLGVAEILAIFPYENKKVAGSKILKGRIAVKDTLIVKRGEEELGRVKVSSIRKLKDSISEATAGMECGIIFEPQLSFQVKDTLEAIKV